MDIDKDKVDDMALALLYLTTFEDKPRLRAGRATVGTSSIVYIARTTSPIQQQRRDQSC
jgi:hypothetical protein